MNTPSPIANAAMKENRSARIARRAIDLVMLVLLIAGFSKALDIVAFAEDLRTWQLLPQSAPPFIALAIPAIEIAVGLAWFLGLWRQAAVAAAALLLIAFTGFYAAHLVAGEPPDCGCLGKLALFEDSIGQSQFVLVRNGALIGFLAVGWWASMRKRLPTRGPVAATI